MERMEPHLSCDDRSEGCHPLGGLGEMWRTRAGVDVGLRLSCRRGLGQMRGAARRLPQSFKLLLKINLLMLLLKMEI